MNDSTWQGRRNDPITPFETLGEKIVTFSILVRDAENVEQSVWNYPVRYTDSIAWKDIYECDGARCLVEDALLALGHQDARERVKLSMPGAEGQSEDVGPAVGHLSFMVDRYAESPHKYAKPPKKISPALLRAMMKSHWSVLARHEAEAAAKQADDELLTVEMEHGMHNLLENEWSPAETSPEEG